MSRYIWLPPFVRARFILFAFNVASALTAIFAFAQSCYVLASVAGVILLVSVVLHSRVARNWETLLQLSMVGPPVTEGEPGAEAVICGMYHPHWEIGHILVVRSLGRWEVFTRYERWRPYGIPLSANPVDRTPLPPQVIRIKGQIGEKGRFGHKGMMHREVEVTAVEEIRPLAPPNTFW